MEAVQLTAEVFIDTGKDFRPEDSLKAEYSCVPGETVRLSFDLTCFEKTVGFRFDPLLEDSSMVRLLRLTLLYDAGQGGNSQAEPVASAISGEKGERREIPMSRIKTNSDVDLEPIYVYLHHDPKFFVDEALCTHLAGAEVEFQVLEIGVENKSYWQDIKKSNVSQRERDQLLGKIEAAMEENRQLAEENRRLKVEHGDIYASGIWKLQHDAKGPLRVLLNKGNIVTFLVSVYVALMSELFWFNNAYYATPRPNGQVLNFQFLRFGLVFLGVFFLIVIVRAAVMKGYRHELY
ncbi:MAG: hypothetical protein HFI33_10745 [Lachnospiraceae bacterium]|nr:hypothetical protein [Lachnospiraceae bacterium]